MGLAAAQQAYAKTPGVFLPPLPEGWLEEDDEVTKTKYYVHVESGKRQWLRPGFNLSTSGPNMTIPMMPPSMNTPNPMMQPPPMNAPKSMIPMNAPTALIQPAPFPGNMSTRPPPPGAHLPPPPMPPMIPTFLPPPPMPMMGGLPIPPAFPHQPPAAG